jgi:hypothetical protein
MKKKIIAFAIVAVTLLALPAFAFAAQDAAVGDNITVEYRYAEGETPDIPASIDRFGQTYNLIGTSDSVLESTLPETRTYTYRVNGALTPAQLAEIQAAGEVSVSPVYLDKEEERDIWHLFTGLETNDVEELRDMAAKTPVSVLLAGTAVEGQTFAIHGISDVSYTVTQWEDAAQRLPLYYSADCVLRGILTTPVLGYYLANATFSTSVTDSAINQYIVVAEYAAPALPPLEDEVIVEEEEIEAPVEPEAAFPTVGLSDEDVARIAGQGSNPFANIADGLTPLGGLGAEGVWSFLSLILSVAAVVIAIALAIGAAVRRSRLKNYENLGIYDNGELALAKKRGNLLRALTIIIGFLTALTWLILDDFSVGMVWVNNHTLIVGILFLVTVVLCGFTNARNARADRYAAEEIDSDIA